MNDRFKQVFAGVATALFLAGPAMADLTLPSPQELIGMSIDQRIALYQAMNALPQNQRDANLAALRQEIDSLSPEQKQQMNDRFKAEFATLPEARQDELRHLLSSPPPQAGQPSGQ